MNWVRRVIRAVALVARDGKIPKPLRAAAALGLLPVPGPFDEAVLLIVGPLLFIFYRQPLREAWNETLLSQTPEAARASPRGGAAAR